MAVRPSALKGDMKISDFLISDHRALTRKVCGLEERLDVGSLTTKELQKMVASLRLALEDHAKLEEHVLFPALVHALGRDDGPLAVMEAEHSRISALFSQIEAARGRGVVAALAKSLTGFLIRHFIKEEQDLFPIADRVLGVVHVDDAGEVRLGGERVR